ARRRRAAAEAEDTEVSGGPAATAGPIPDGVEPPIPEPEPGDDAASTGATAAGQQAGGSSPRSTPPPTHTTASWWEATAGTATPPGDVRRETRQRTHAGPGLDVSPAGGPTRADTPPTGSGSGTGLDATVASVRDLLEGADPGLVARVGRAVIGWAPIALAIGWLMGEASGCARASATCADELAPIAWIAQVAALVILLLLPRLATVTAIATVVSLGAAIPGALLLSATGSTDAVRISRTVLGGLLVIAWAVGLVVAGWREVRRGRAGTSGRAGPVS
ncbi:MAG TPA: hypothetical protein VD763_00945, partial [Candidatus Saccharimonadales bacterium]|nr:hypothetical protein [Candidatus Saccharimonadales bacterium]